MVGHKCHSCNTTDTPEWRRGPDGARTLCNACGLRMIITVFFFSNQPNNVLSFFFFFLDYSKLLRKGSLTVQTHNYLVEAPPDGPQQQPRAIQFPIIQVNNTNNNTGKNETIRSLPGPSAITKSSFSKYSTSAL